MLPESLTESFVRTFRIEQRFDKHDAVARREHDDLVFPDRLSCCFQSARNDKIAHGATANIRRALDDGFGLRRETRFYPFWSRSRFRCFPQCGHSVLSERREERSLMQRARYRDCTANSRYESDTNSG